MKSKKTRFVLLFVLAVFIAVYCYSETKKESKTVYFMKPGVNDLVVVETHENNDEPEKIYYNNTDYTPYLEEFFNLKPLAFVSPKVLMFSENEVIFKDGYWNCHDCIAVIPGYTELTRIEAVDISYDAESNSLICSNAIMQSKKIGAKKK